MSKSKQKQGSASHILPTDLAQETAKYLTLKEISALARTSKPNSQLFQPILNKAKEVHPLLTAVVRGRPKALAFFVKKNPELLFKKGQITDPAGQTFYDVSPYQLITFLCDDDMKQSIMQLASPMMTEQMARSRQEQYAEINNGGADLVKMHQNPAFLPFEEVTRFRTSYTIGNQTINTTFPLLENSDGIIYYKDASTGKEHLFYASQETLTVEPIEPKAHSKQEHQALDKLYASLGDMEMNSSRRSNNAEHALIARTMQHKLSRKGIQYDRDNVRYCDYRADFNQYSNAYRKCIRLYLEKKWDDGDNSLRTDVGQAQRKIMWLLQRFCEEGRRFNPLPDFKASPFIRREVKVKICRSEHDNFIYIGNFTFNSNAYKTEPLLLDGHIVTGLGSDFAIRKNMELHSYAVARRSKAFINPSTGNPIESFPSWLMPDLFAVQRLVEDAKANVVELTGNVDQDAQNAVASPSILR